MKQLDVLEKVPFYLEMELHIAMYIQFFVCYTAQLLKK